jgi:hypothetical protein
MLLENKVAVFQGAAGAIPNREVCRSARVKP